MKGRHYREYSGILERELPFFVLGHGGKPVVVFPTQSGRCTDFNDFQMVDTVSELIEQGRIQLFCVDSIDRETWNATHGDAAQRTWLQELWFRHITEEFLPRLRAINGSDAAPLTTGCSLGATHALNTFLRRPDLFDGVIALSGFYDARYFFGSYMDGRLYDNSIVDYLSNLPEDHQYVPMYNARSIILCAGQGAWEEESERTTRMVQELFACKGIRACVDIWGHDVTHDWPWWRKQFPYFLNNLLF
ncbi:alpha/beta hydrolase-fold protein [uncultured Mailhella sp.]|uniref:esterase family protein n=1 Tax=uncultured Mailhella sp. TaxID=1981031 RepID=UPI002615C718|nr:alpha/beta hydrolase-fold protein [uncultured Mailhella sp.]